MADTESRLAVLEQIARDTQRALERIEHRLDLMEQRTENLGNREDRHFLWLLSFQIAGFAALLGVMAHGFNWI